MTTQKTVVRETVLKALSQSLKSVFGESGAFAFCCRLEENYSLKLEDVFDKPQVFAKVLEQIFGDTGAEIIEALLTKDMCTKLGVKEVDHEINSLADCFDKLKTIFEGVYKTRHIGD